MAALRRRDIAAVAKLDRVDYAPRRPMEKFAEFLVWYLVFIFSTTCHEAAHAWIAQRGGDDTASALGHVTLDPTPHIRREPFGMVFVPILSFALAGWMIGWASVPFNPHWGARYPKRMAWMSLAGPATNFLLATIALVAIRVLSAYGVFQRPYGGGTAVGLVELPEGYDFSSPLGAVALALSVMLQLNVILGVYNLIPVPPLDGASVVEGFGSPSIRSFYERIRVNPMFSILGLILAWQLFPLFVRPVFSVVLQVLYS
jgi:Zn-dependent protease